MAHDVVSAQSDDCFSERWWASMVGLDLHNGLLFSLSGLMDHQEDIVIASSASRS